MNQNKQKWLKASLTIEASIIIPLIIMIIIMITYVSFFLYNRCIISQNTYITAFRGSLFEEGVTDPTVSDRIVYMDNENSSLYGKKLIGIKNFHLKCEIQDKYITVYSNACVKVPLSLLSGNGFQNEWVIKEQKKAKIIKEIDRIRNYRKLEKIVNEVSR